MEKENFISQRGTHFILSNQLERPIAFYPFLARALGDVESAIFYQQLHFWSDKGSLKDGWIYKSKKEIEDETTLTRTQQDRIRKKLVKLDWIEIKVVKAVGAPTLHYRCKMDFSISTNHAYPLAQSRPIEKHKRDLSSITENTTENTTENIAPETGAGSPQKKSKVLFTTLGADILKEFEDKVDPKNGTYYNNKTQRAAADFLIEEYSFEKVSKVISILQKTNKIPYYPKIYSPADLKEKWQALRDAIETKKTELIGKEPKFII